MLIWFLIDKKQADLMEGLGIKMVAFDIHHPVPRYFWQRLDWFISKFEENDIHMLKKNKRFCSYCRIQEILMLHLGFNELNDRKDFLDKLKNLEAVYGYRRKNSIPKSFHEAYNKAFRNCQPADLMKSCDSIFDNDNYDKKKIEAILRLLYIVAILENKIVTPKMAAGISKDLADGNITMKGVLARLGINKKQVVEYLEELFLPRHYEEMEGFFGMLVQINMIRMRL